jgi:hypothetical protein
MTVGELISELGRFDAQAEVVFAGESIGDFPVELVITRVAALDDGRAAVCDD